MTKYKFQNITNIPKGIRLRRGVAYKIKSIDKSEPINESKDNKIENNLEKIRTLLDKTSKKIGYESGVAFDSRAYTNESNEIF